MVEKISHTEIELFVISQIKKMREQHGLSQSDFAFKMNVSYGFIGNVESPRHRAKYNLNHINQAAKVFGCPVKDLMPDNPL